MRFGGRGGWCCCCGSGGGGGGGSGGAGGGRKLCFDPREFAAVGEQPFDAAGFVSRHLAGTSQDVLRADLAAHGERLRAQLVDLLNRDYADFIALAADLVGTTEAIERIKTHLVALLARVQAAHTHVLAVRAADVVVCGCVRVLVRGRVPSWVLVCAARACVSVDTDGRKENIGTLVC